MSHIRIDKQKAVKKWGPVLENMGVSVDKVEWMSEMAEYHSINENAYANATTAGMGNVVSAIPSTLAGALNVGVYCLSAVRRLPLNSKSNTFMKNDIATSNVNKFTQSISYIYLHRCEIF